MAQNQINVNEELLHQLFLGNKKDILGWQLC
jgi:hypothetical protein